jgi:hypothetical protein
MLVALYTSRMRFFRRHYGPQRVKLHAVAIALGMLRASLMAWRGFAAGTLDHDELRARLWAFGKVTQQL